VIPDDPSVAAFDAAGRALVELPRDSTTSAALDDILDVVLAPAAGGA
jgi:hypothetical protein